MIFAEALTTIEEYRQFTDAINVPVLANLTEFGKTPLFTTGELAEVGVGMTLYPLSAFRAMSAAAMEAFTRRFATTARSRRGRHDADAHGAVRRARLPGRTKTSSTHCSRNRA